MPDRTNPIASVRELIHLGFQYYLPAPALRPWVQSYWSVTARLPVATMEKMYPDGGSSVVLDFSNDHSLEPRFSAFQTVNVASFSGCVDLFGVRLRPGGAFGLLGLPAVELMGHAWSLQELSIHGASTLFEQMREVDSALRSQLMDTWLLERSAAPRCAGPVQKLLPALECSDESMTTMLSRAGIGRRRFERLFNEQVGISPSQLRQLLRVRRARFLIKVAPELGLSEVALRCGYFDQAHFTRQFQRVVGRTPGDYRDRQLTRMALGEMGLR